MRLVLQYYSDKPAAVYMQFVTVISVKMTKLSLCVLLAILCFSDGYLFRTKVDKTKCPIVKAVRNFDLNQVNTIPYENCTCEKSTLSR